eukprot:6460437-Amphidinium_carterae.2
MPILEKKEWCLPPKTNDNTRLVLVAQHWCVELRHVAPDLSSAIAHFGVTRFECTASPSKSENVLERVQRCRDGTRRTKIPS